MYTANRVPKLMMFISFTVSLILSNLYSHYTYNPLSANSLAISYVILTYTDSLHSVSNFMSLFQLFPLFQRISQVEVFLNNL